MGAGEFSAAELPLREGVYYEGLGVGVTSVKLPASADTDVFITDDFASLTGGSSTSGPADFGISKLTVDGNKANNSSGYPIRIYGRRYTMNDFEIVDGKSGGLYSQWGSGGSSMESYIARFKIRNCTGTAFYFNGPHDSQIGFGVVNRDSSLSGNTDDLIHASTYGGAEWSNVHAWGSCSTAWKLGVTSHCVNCTADGAGVNGVWFRASGSSWIGGAIYGTAGAGPTGVETGIRFGSTSESIFVGDITVDTYMWNYISGDVLFALENQGYLDVRVRHHTGASNPTINSGSWPVTAKVDVLSDASGSSYVQTPSVVTPNVQNGLVMWERTDPSAPGSNTGVMYVRDNGSGKSQLCVRFPTGAVQVIATEP